MSYEKLFTPFKIGKMEVKNRLVMSPMGTNSALANGRKTDNEIDYFIVIIRKEQHRQSHKVHHLYHQLHH